MIDPREYVLQIISTELLDVTGRLNGKLLRSHKYTYLRDIIYVISSCLDEQDDITHRIRWIQLGYTIPPTCKMCNNRVRYQKQTSLFNTYCCSKCRQSDPDVIVKIKQTNQHRYGVDSPLQSKKIQERIERTNLKRYGVKRPFQSTKIQQQVRSNILQKYDVASTSLLPEVKQQQIKTRNQKYGVDFIFQSSEFQYKIYNETKQKYDNKHPTQLHISDTVLNSLQNNDWMYDQYIIQGKSIHQISTELSISDVVVGKYLRNLDINIRSTNAQSYKAIQWLESIMEYESIHIQHALNGGEYKIPGTRYKADGYCKETNTIYEFHGDYWHGNPEVYESDIINESTHCTMGELYQKTLIKERNVRELGYNLVIVWEKDFDYR